MPSVSFQDSSHYSLRSAIWTPWSWHTPGHQTHYWSIEPSALRSSTLVHWAHQSYQSIAYEPDVCGCFVVVFCPSSILRSHQDRYWLATVRIYGNFISHPTGKQGHQYHDLISHSITLSWNWTNQSLPYPHNVECLDRKRQVSILKSLVWLNRCLTLWGPNHLVSQNGRWTRYSSSHPGPQTKIPDLYQWKTSFPCIIQKPLCLHSDLYIIDDVAL